MHAYRHFSDHWREDPRGYAAGFGFRCDSEIARLVEYIRAEYRVKYGTDYRLRRIGKNRFRAVPGDFSSCGVSYAVEASKLFNTSLTYDKYAKAGG
jgi:hypothetical protein